MVIIWKLFSPIRYELFKILILKDYKKEAAIATVNKSSLGMCKMLIVQYNKFLYKLN